MQTPRKFTPSDRLRRNAMSRDLAMKRPKRPDGLIWHLAVSHELQTLEGLKRRLREALSHKAKGLNYRICRLRGGLTRTWDDLIELIKGDIRLRLLQVRALQTLAITRGFRLPG